MKDEPYGAGRIPDHWSSGRKRPVEGEIVVVSGLKLKSRGLRLIEPQTRVVNKNEIHELIATDAVDAMPGVVVDNVLYVGFFEVTVGGVVIFGDDVTIGNLSIGKIAGFNDIHSPNHLNIVMKANSQFAQETNISQGDRLVREIPVNLKDRVRLSR
jgi:hypothetical protein